MSWLAGRENVQYNIVQYHRHSKYRTERLYRHPAHLSSRSIIMKATVTHAMQCNVYKTDNRVLGQSAMLFVVKTKYLQLIKSIKALRFAFENYTGRYY